MFIEKLKTRKAAIVAAGSGLLAGVANAAPQAIDVSGVVSQIEAGMGPVGQIGAAVLALMGVVAIWKFMRRAM